MNAMRAPCDRRGARIGVTGLWLVIILFAVSLIGVFEAAAQSPLSESTQRLFAAVERNDLPETQSSIVLGADVFARNAKGQTPTELAVDRGHFDIAHYLLSVRNVMRAIAIAPEPSPPARQEVARAAPPATGLPMTQPRALSPVPPPLAAEANTIPSSPAIPSTTAQTSVAMVTPPLASTAPAILEPRPEDTLPTPITQAPAPAGKPDATPTANDPAAAPSLAARGLSLPAQFDTLPDPSTPMPALIEPPSDRPTVITAGTPDNRNATANAETLVAPVAPGEPAQVAENLPPAPQPAQLTAPSAPILGLSPAEKASLAQLDEAPSTVTAASPATEPTASASPQSSAGSEVLPVAATGTSDSASTPSSRLDPGTPLRFDEILKALAENAQKIPLKSGDSTVPATDKKGPAPFETETAIDIPESAALPPAPPSAPATQTPDITIPNDFQNVQKTLAASAKQRPLIGVKTPPPADQPEPATTETATAPDIPAGAAPQPAPPAASVPLTAVAASPSAPDFVDTPVTGVEDILKALAQNAQQSPLSGSEPAPAPLAENAPARVTTRSAPTASPVITEASPREPKVVNVPETGVKDVLTAPTQSAQQSPISGTDPTRKIAGAAKISADTMTPSGPPDAMTAAAEPAPAVSFFQRLASAFSSNPGATSPDTVAAARPAPDRPAPPVAATPLKTEPTAKAEHGFFGQLAELMGVERENPQAAAATPEPPTAGPPQADDIYVQRMIDMIAKPDDKPVTTTSPAEIATITPPAPAATEAAIATETTVSKPAPKETAAEKTAAMSAPPALSPAPAATEEIPVGSYIDRLTALLSSESYDDRRATKTATKAASKKTAKPKATSRSNDKSETLLAEVGSKGTTVPRPPASDVRPAAPGRATAPTSTPRAAPTAALSSPSNGASEVLAMAPDPGAIPAPPPSRGRPTTSPHLLELPQAIADPSPGPAHSPLDPPPALVANQAIAGEPRLAGAPARPRAPSNVIESSAKSLPPIERVRSPATNAPTRVAALNGGNGWTVKDVQIAKVPPSLPKQRSKVLSPKDYLQGRVMTIGQSIRMGKGPREKETKPGIRNGCVPKRDPSVMFCIEPVDWPKSVRHHFDVSTIMYIGPRAIIRYDDAKATYLYSLFLSNSFDALAKHFEGLYGPPTETIKRVIAPLAQPRLSNPTMIWRSVDPKTSRITNLEIRRFDDARGGFPDTRHGVLLFHQAWTPAIFPMLSTLELMRIVR